MVTSSRRILAVVLLRNAGVHSRGRIIIYSGIYSGDPLLVARAWFTRDDLGQGTRAALRPVLEYLGYDATLYDGSFVEWSNKAGDIVV